MILTPTEHLEIAEHELAEQDTRARENGHGTIGAAAPTMTTTERLNAHLSIAITHTTIESQAALLKAAEEAADY